MHVQSSCFACLNLFLFCRSRCRRRLRCVNSLLLLWGGKLVVLLPEWCKGRSFVLRLWGGKLVVLLPEYKKLTLKLTSSIGASAIRNSRRMIEH